ncbi:hypothetical protein ALP10_200172 [Pseudomonas syringae pv. helianthi]|uniref:Uncharacterized protein n=1 Tax=Pseudomonas syringae pv. helianthi TaxID=251654 RepID=A0A3M6CPT5_9PSED|nr:hypothetical protein ALP10_200172 [Pseudomonas syringae pv. helianthi]
MRLRNGKIAQQPFARPTARFNGKALAGGHEYPLTQRHDCPGFRYTIQQQLSDIGTAALYGGVAVGGQRPNAQTKYFRGDEGFCRPIDPIEHINALVHVGRHRAGWNQKQAFVIGVGNVGNVVSTGTESLPMNFYGVPVDQLDACRDHDPRSDP